MCEPTTIATIATWFGATAETAATIGTVGSVAGAAASAYGVYAGAQNQKAAAQANANLAEVKAQDALRRGQEQRQEIQRRGAMLEATQRAQMSARGLDLAEGTPSDVLAGTEFWTASDAVTATDNSRREAWANRAQRGNYQSQADAISPGLTLLAGAGSVADKWYRSRPAGK